MVTLHVDVLHVLYIVRCLSIEARKKHTIPRTASESESTNLHNGAESIVKTAAKLIVSEIRNQTFDCGYYSDNDHISDVQKNVDWLTLNLKLFMEVCASSSLQQGSIRQCIIHAIRPRSTLPSMLFRLAV